MKSIPLILVLTGCFFSCKSNKESQYAVYDSKENYQAHTLNEKLLGNWNWVKTNCCGRISKITTPKSTNTIIKYTFINNNVLVVTTNQNNDTSSYNIANSFNAEKDTMILIGNKKTPAYLHFFKDTLVIDYSYIDLQTEWYVKVKAK